MQQIDKKNKTVGPDSAEPVRTPEAFAFRDAEERDRRGYQAKPQRKEEYLALKARIDLAGGLNCGAAFTGLNLSIDNESQVQAIYACSRSAPHSDSRWDATEKAEHGKYAHQS